MVKHFYDNIAVLIVLFFLNPYNNPYLKETDP